MKFWFKVSLVLLTLVALTTSAFGNNYPYPGKNNAVVKCNDCPEPNAGLPTYNYHDPIVDHVGRFVDSSRTINAQHNGLGMRTVRARAIRPNFHRDRIYLALGETVGSYDMDTFFTTVLPTPMSLVSVLRTGSSYGRYGTPLEKIAAPDSWMYPEAQGSGWNANHSDDFQISLNDFDSDDRGYVYMGTEKFGWGIGRDVNLTGVKQMEFVAQEKDLDVPNAVISLKVGTKYYAIASTATSSSGKTKIFEVTTPANPVLRVTREGRQWGIISWTKNDELQRLVIACSDTKLRVFDYTAFIAGGAPIAEYAPSAGNRKFPDAAIDDNGRIWAVETGSNLLWRLTPSGNSYTKSTLNVYGGTFAPHAIAVGGGYVAIGGKSDASELRLFKLEGDTPNAIDIDNFFRKYYHDAPAGYSNPSSFSPSYTSFADVGLIEHNNKTYLIYSAEGLGDVYEIEAGEGISAEVSSTYFGTVNPNAESTEDGPFYGDILRFNATSNNPNASYQVNWDFDTSTTSDLVRQTELGEDIDHQYTGLTTVAKITAPKGIHASASTDNSIAADISVTLKVPTVRLGIPGRSIPMTGANKEPFYVVAGDKFTDASDGAIEGHVTSWTIDSGVAVKTKPDGEMPVGLLGAHELDMIASYGEYDPTTLTGANPYNLTLANLDYEVVPFFAKIRPPTSNSTNFTFGADARRTIGDTTILNATQWTVTWTLTAGGTSSQSLNQTETKTVNVGTVPAFVVPKSSVTNGSVLTLQISVAPTAVPLAQYATFTDSVTLTIPDPVVKKSGCAHAGDPCTLTAETSGGDDAPSTWNLSWSIKKGTETVKTGTDNPITFTPTTAGSYRAIVTETTFGVASPAFDFTVASALCGPIAEQHQANPGTDCAGTCQPNTDIEFTPNFFGYTVQACDTFAWDFGDGGKATTEVAKHKFTTAKTYSVKFTLKNTTGQRTWTISLQVGSGGPEPPVCAAPAAITFTWSGSKGCHPNKACEVGESVKFTGLRAAAQLLNCDNATWVIDGNQTTTKSPSQTFTSTGNVTVSLVVSNTEGTSPSVSKTLNIVPATGTNCSGSVPETSLGIEFEGPQSGCAVGSTTPCAVGEQIRFNPTAFGYTFQACDKYEWNFGDGTQSTSQSPTKAYTEAVNRRVTLRVYNTTNPTGVTKFVDVPFSDAPVKPTPELSFSAPAATAGKGVPVTFTVNSNINATGWSITTDDGAAADNSKASSIGKQITFTRTFTKTGAVTLRVSARNSEDVTTAPIGQALTVINVTETPEFRYLLPVVTHGPGQNNSVWRTDVQIYNPDPNVSDTNQLELTATFNGMNTTLHVAQSTYIYEDFMQRLTTANSASGPVILSTRAKFAPQIWTRTYNQTANGTFGQFIPAIRLDAAGGGAAVGTGKYLLAGLKNDARYRTNLGFVNPNAQAISITVRVYDDQRLEIGNFTRQLQPFVLDQFPITHPTAVPNLKGDRPFSIEIEVPPNGSWLIGYASFIDGASNDPVYLQAIRESELASADYRDSFIPGVGHVGAWRSDVTIFNPNASSVPVDLTYYDQTGSVKGEAKSVLVRAGEFLQYSDIIKQGVFGANVPDGLGSLRVSVPAEWNPSFFPMAFTRTYNDDGSGKTYGQGIAGFAAARANVKPGKPALIPAVRNVKDDTNKTIYYTNIGLTNVSATDAVVTVRVLNPNTGVEILAPQYPVKAFQSVLGRIDIGNFANASLKIEVTGGNVWAFASIIDDRTKDPEYVAASPIAQ